MTKLNDRFWAKVMFEDFTNHYRKMDKEQIFADVMKSMDDLYERNAEGDSFGAFMVRLSLGRSAQYPKASANGKNGGRPPVKIPLPKDKQEVLNFAADHGLDVIDAGNWYEANIVERKGRDKYGKPIDNWKGAVTNNDKSMKEKRRQLKNAC